MAEGNKYAGNSKVDREKDVPSITALPATDEQPEKLDAVIQSGRAMAKKPSLGSRLKANFVGEDAGTVGSYIFQEILVPSIKGMIIDVVQQGIVRAVGGTGLMGGSRVPGSKQGGYTPYSAMSTAKVMGKPDPRESAASAIRPQTYDQIAFAEMGDAELVLDRMFDQVRQYNVVTVANLYDFAAVSNMGNFQDNKWGWTVDMLRGVRVGGTLRQGYFLNLPRPVPLD